MLFLGIGDLLKKIVDKILGYIGKSFSIL